MSNTFIIESGTLTINVSVICYDSYDCFSEQWEGTDKHHGGVTIANPEHGRGAYKYFIPKQYTLADLTSDYAKQGLENPSTKAYQSLRDQLRRDIYASDYGFRVSAYVGDFKMIDDECIGYGFDHSIYDDDDLITAARSVWDEYDTTAEVVKMAKKAAADIVAIIPVLTEFAN